MVIIGLKRNSRSKKNLKPYQKPIPTRVKLVPEETVLGGCKLSYYVYGPNDTGTSQLNDRDFFDQLS